MKLESDLIILIHLLAWGYGGVGGYISVSIDLSILFSHRPSSNPQTRGWGGRCNIAMATRRDVRRPSLLQCIQPGCNFAPPMKTQNENERKEALLCAFFLFLFPSAYALCLNRATRRETSLPPNFSAAFWTSLITQRDNFSRSRSPRSGCARQTLPPDVLASLLFPSIFPLAASFNPRLIIRTNFQIILMSSLSKDIKV